MVEGDQGRAADPLMQSRLGSILETIANQAVGFVLSVLTYTIIFPVLGIASSLSMNISLTLIFTALSMLRSYSLRRLFNWFQAQRILSWL
jgi:hypothetical protein